MKITTLSCLLVGAFTASMTFGQAPIVTPEPLACMPTEGHSVVYADVDPLPGDDDEVRIFFRRDGFGDYYYVIMEVLDENVPNRYRGVVPVPEPDNLSTQMYLGVIAPDRTLVSRSLTTSVAIDEDCDVEVDDGANFVVGETSYAQKNRKIAWWQCEDVTSRIDVNGEVRDEGSCVPVILWWQRPEILVPTVLGSVGGVVLVDDLIDPNPPSPVSPSTP
ncbi:MAG: hypothetical protein K8J08_14840 [Thermoanaerobaculia bacterium]|nr:hypothetical protein [Thermoanaerobaculia bacterium]